MPPHDPTTGGAQPTTAWTQNYGTGYNQPHADGQQQAAQGYQIPNQTGGYQNSNPTNSNPTNQVPVRRPCCNLPLPECALALCWQTTERLALLTTERLALLPSALCS